jgi:hypothetical protein
MVSVAQHMEYLLVLYRVPDFVVLVRQVLYEDQVHGTGIAMGAVVVLSQGAMHPSSPHISLPTKQLT